MNIIGKIVYKAVRTVVFTEVYGRVVLGVSPIKLVTQTVGKSIKEKRLKKETERERIYCEGTVV